MIFKQKLIDDGFAYIPSFISEEKAFALFENYKNCKVVENSTDEQAPNSSYCVYNFKPFLELLCVKNMDVVHLIGEMVFPTYSYARIYRKGNVLERHVDRPACEISLTVHLWGDKKWPIYMEKPNGEAVNVVLNPGDAVLYLGCETPHWRNAYEGEEYGQVFLHYVLSNGIYWEQYFNLKNMIEQAKSKTKKFENGREMDSESNQEARCVA